MIKSKIKSKNKWVGLANDVPLHAKLKATQSCFSSQFISFPVTYMTCTSLFSGEGSCVMVIFLNLI